MNKGRVINFEWMRDYNKWSAEDFNVLRTKLISKEIDQAAEDGCNIIVGVYLLDGFLQPKANLKDFLLHIHAIKDLKKQRYRADVYCKWTRRNHRRIASSIFLF